MLTIEITPRFCETDALGHINNCVLLEWFEQARVPIFKVFTPDLDPKKWQLILAHNSIDYLAPILFSRNVEVRTHIEKIGTSSMTIIHEAFQNSIQVAKGKAIMVTYDYSMSKSRPLKSDEIKYLNEI